MSAVTPVTPELLRGMPLPRLNEDGDKDEKVSGLHEGELALAAESGKGRDDAASSRPPDPAEPRRKSVQAMLLRGDRLPVRARRSPSRRPAEGGKSAPPRQSSRDPARVFATLFRTMTERKLGRVREPRAASVTFITEGRLSIERMCDRARGARWRFLWQWR